MEVLRVPDITQGTYLVEGVVERDADGRCIVRTEGPDGEPLLFDPDRALSGFVGQEIRLTIASFEAIDAIASRVETLDTAEVSS
jgi:hypothetical protein